MDKYIYNNNNNNKSYYWLNIIKSKYFNNKHFSNMISFEQSDYNNL